MEHTKGSFAVVTGASSGIGLELAKQFAEHGFDLLIVADSSKISEAASTLKRYDVSVSEAQIDLAGPDGVDELYEVIQDAGRPVDAIALNAGVGAGGDFVRETDLDDDLNVIDLNIRSTVHLAKLVLKDMVGRGQGRVLFTSSIESTMPGAFNAVYNASKAFMVTALIPGATETNFFHRAGMDDTKVGRSEKDDPADVAKAGFEALMSGEDHVVAGSFKNKYRPLWLARGGARSFHDARPARSGGQLFGGRKPVLLPSHGSVIFFRRFEQLVPAVSSGFAALVAKRSHAGFRERLEPFRDGQVLPQNRKRIHSGDGGGHRKTHGVAKGVFHSNASL